MTTHFIDICLLPDPEFGQPLLLGALYAKLHRALVTMNSSDIGISFPGYCLRPRGLGAVFRLHSEEAALQRLMATEWMHGMRDHTNTREILPIPSITEHRQLLRRQFKTSAERMRRRRMRRKGETPEQALIAIPDEVERQPTLPFVQLRSQSTGQTFCIFLELAESLAEPRRGVFNSYGLSTTATLPWF
ncbi:type I-F CRISPR-associated endoribonuclease Cas6/Csy4 [Pusillimonas sp.]|uniref:type I-F CRISPR-associated endoribonuclease Cas6/Csy4 n=1 Tax=Pusillimonas sp. TaxID=3040095 RepID=UPI0037C51C93